MEMGVENVGDYLSERAEDMGDACAVKEAVEGAEGKRLKYKCTTFKELELQANRLSHFLKKKEIQRGMKVLVLVRPGLELMRLVFALFKIGAVPVIIDPGMGFRNFLACVQQVKPEGLMAVPVGYWLSKLFYKTFTSVKIAIKVVPGYFEKEQCTAPLLEKTKHNDLAAILFTSGSTGKPKGVEYEHGMFMAQLKMIQEEYKIEPGEIDFPMLPVFALLNPGLGVTTIVPQMNPSRPAKADPIKLVQAITQEKVTNSFGSPAIWHSVVDYCEKKKIDLPSLKRVLIAGAPVEPLLIERLKKLMPRGEVFTPYGATEALPMTSISGLEILREAAGKRGLGKGMCVGRVLKGAEVKIVARGGEDELLGGEVGDIIVKSPSVTKGYHELRNATRLAKIYTENGLWHRMGDVGYKDGEGRIWLCGRVVEVVCSEDGNIYYPACCEGIFNQHPAVYRTALIGLGEGVHKKPAVVVEFKKGKRINKLQVLEELRKIAKEHLTTKGIEIFLVQKDLPVDVRHNAKIHRLKLGKIYTQKLKIK